MEAEGEGPGLVSEALSVVPIQLGLLDGRDECNNEFECGLLVSHAFDIVRLKLFELCVWVVLSRVCVERGSHTSCAMYEYGMTGVPTLAGRSSH